MARKAEAFKEYNEAAKVDMLMAALPKVWSAAVLHTTVLFKPTFCLTQMAAEVSRPIAQVKKITMVSSGNGEVGASKLSGEVTSHKSSLRDF